MVWRVSFFVLFLSFTLLASSPNQCPKKLADGATWESLLKEIRSGLFVGFRQEGTPSTAPLLENSDGSPLRFRKVANRIAYAEKVRPTRKSQSFSAYSPEHAGVFLNIQSEIEKGEGEYCETLRRARGLKRLGNFVAAGSAGGTILCAFAQNWETASILLPQIFLSKFLANSLASITARELGKTTVGQQIKQLESHASLVNSPVAGAWAATGFNRESYSYQWIGDNVEPLVDVHEEFLDVYTWVDPEGTPQTRILSYSTKAP